MTPIPFRLSFAIGLVGALGSYDATRTSAAECPPAPADAAPDRLWAASLRWENDAFGGTDEFYTDGVAVGVSHTGPSWLDPVADWLPWGEGRRTVSYGVTQAMFTPDDVTAPVPDPNDRPYAGILSLGLALHVEGDRSYHGLMFATGIVGPGSLAEQTQDIVHRLTGSVQSEGWDAQLSNEPILNLAYEYRHKFRLLGERRGWSLEGLPLAGAWLGNVLTQAEIGAIVRGGYNIPDDFGPTFVRGMQHMPPPKSSEAEGSESGWGFSVYAGLIGNLVLRDITLDGNTFQDGPSVDKNLFVPAAGMGVSVGTQSFQASFTYVFLGEEFENQPQLARFGAITCSFAF